MPVFTAHAGQHQSHRLFAELDQVRPCAGGVTCVPEQIQGTSFFPGGVGLWVDQTGSIPSFPVGGVMILGQDFHSVTGYQASLKAGKESETSPTWRNLLDLLRRVPIPVSKCFFTNAYMGLREGSATTGRFPGTDDRPFTEKCREFFLNQVSTQMPSLIVVFGGYVPHFLAPLSSKLAQWESTNSFSDRDSRNLSLVDGVTFDGCNAPPCVVVSIVHPSFRNSNIRHRRYRSLRGDDAEVAMVRQAWKNAQGGRHE